MRWKAPVRDGVADAVAHIRAIEQAFGLAALAALTAVAPPSPSTR